MAFPENQYGSASKIQNSPQAPSFNQNFQYMVPVWERNSLNLCFNNSLTQNPLKANSFMKENMQGTYNNNSPVKGKWSVNSHMFQNNQSAVVDRVKEILLKNFSDSEKIRQVKMLLNIPIEEEEMIKIEEDELISHVVYNKHIKNENLQNICEEVKEEKEEDFIEKVEKVDKNQSDTHPEKSQKQKLESATKQRKPFKV